MKQRIYACNEILALGLKEGAWVMVSEADPLVIVVRPEALPGDEHWLFTDVVDFEHRCATGLSEMTLIDEADCPTEEEYGRFLMDLDRLEKEEAKLGAN